MGDPLPVLIKLAEKKVEAVQQELARTRAAREAFLEQVRRHEEERARGFEVAAASNDPMSLQAAGHFAERMQKEIDQAMLLVRGLEAREGELKADLQAKFAEQKRYEILLEKKQLEAKKKHARKVQEALDDRAQRRS